MSLNMVVGHRAGEGSCVLEERKALEVSDGWEDPGSLDEALL